MSHHTPRDRALDIPTLTDCSCQAIVYSDGSGVDIEWCNTHKAAPELLEALVAFVDWLDGSYGEGGAMWYLVPDTLQTKARSAIAKAREKK